jgi:alpha-tubulin suppressor-like RCC1 family protein
MARWTHDVYTPVQVVGIDGTGFLTGATQLSVGDAHTCATLSNDIFVCWGSDRVGELGNDTWVVATPRGIPHPVQVS